MKRDFLKSIIEKTASRTERENSNIFVKQELNEEAFNLWQQSPPAQISL